MGVSNNEVIDFTRYRWKRMVEKTNTLFQYDEISEEEYLERMEELGYDRDVLKEAMDNFEGNVNE